MASAQTGTGKTAAFILPIIELLQIEDRPKRLQVHSLILTPTRELAAQVEANARGYTKYLSLRSDAVFGGVSIRPQVKRLQSGVDILVATPGRLLDLINQRTIRFDNLKVLVLDEADRMLDMGFIRDIKKIIEFLPKDRQNMMFSATFSAPIKKLALGLLNDPVAHEGISHSRKQKPRSKNPRPRGIQKWRRQNIGRNRYCRTGY